MNQTKRSSNVIKISDQAFEEINSSMKNQLVNDEIEIIFAISKNGETMILEADPERRFLVTDECSGQNLILESPKEVCGDSHQATIGEFVAQSADEKVVKEFTVGKIVKKVVPLGLTLYTESGCLCGFGKCYHW